MTRGLPKPNTEHIVDDINSKLAGNQITLLLHCAQIANIPALSLIPLEHHWKIPF